MFVERLLLGASATQTDTFAILSILDSGINTLRQGIEWANSQPRVTNHRDGRGNEAAFILFGKANPRDEGNALSRLSQPVDFLSPRV
ncbi:MAG: hypothetical protein KF791_02330 [Verrucomicrobiae bacterium]|nr:hypothetical protein [Verrucomicrobiae bacterium]